MASEGLHEAADQLSPETEHAAMVLEWLRRRDTQLDRHLRTYLFTTGPVLEIEKRGDAR